MEFNFNGKRALVTGAAQGMGLEIVKALSSCGAQVVALDILGDTLKEAVGKLPGVQQVVVDLADWYAVQAVLKRIGMINLVVNNAALHLPAAIWEMSKEDLDRTFDVNLKSVINICQYVVKDLITAGECGSIVNVSSPAGSRGFVDNIAYCTSKAALDHFSRCLAFECGPHNIRVNIVSPGLTKTTMGNPEIENNRTFQILAAKIAMTQKISKPEDVVPAVLFLLSDQHSSRITGTTLTVDGGLSIT